jgi:acetyl/propionyl-CoA carboxylase alpha subunit
VSPNEAVEAVRDVGYPVMVKAAMGGGGIGMGVARGEAELREAVATASSRGERFFADASVLLERYVPGARHVEVQVLADDHGTIHLYERECSVQRRHQKVIEETPSPAVDRELRKRMCSAAVRSMEALGYRGAGTVEWVLDADDRFFFLEVNARLQVEHPITEVTTGVDLVEEQLRIAAGRGMSLPGTRPGTAMPWSSASTRRTRIGSSPRRDGSPGWRSISHGISNSGGSTSVTTRVTRSRCSTTPSSAR